MPNSDFIPTTEEGKAALFERFRDNIQTFAATLALSPAEVSAQADDATWFRSVLNHSITMRDFATQWTNYKNLLLNGSGSATVPANPAALPVGITTTDPGVLPRFRELCRRIKANAAYTEAMGEALGIVGPDPSPHDLSTLAPDISLRSSGGQVEVVWNKNGMEAVEIQKDPGTGTWQFLAIDTRPNYIDTTPFPAPSAKWKYRAIYTEDSQRVGQWSNTAEITVGG
jgi:hypothetical protein